VAGAVLGAVLGLVGAAFYFGKGGDVAKEWWLQLLLSICFGALGAVAGGVGGVLGWGLARLIQRVSPEGAARRVRPGMWERPSPRSRCWSLWCLRS